MVFEYLEMDLQTFIQKKKPSQEQALSIARQLLEGINYCH